jgi:hypothetical protein
VAEPRVSDDSDDSDIDELLGATIARVGESPKVAAAAAQLEAQIAASTPVPRPLVDPRTLELRFTRLKAFAQSGRHYLQSCQDEVDESIATRMGVAPGRPKSVAIQIGAGFHAGLFLNRPVVCFHGRRQGKAWERFERRNRELGAVILSDAEYGKTTAMIRAVKEHPRAMELLFADTVTEKTLRWPHVDRACRRTPDAVHVAGDHQAELKSTRCAEPRWLAREALRRFYHAQMGFYDGAIEREIGRRPGEDRIVAVENVPPHNVTVLRLTDEARVLGDKLVHIWFERLLAAELHGHYGHYVEADVDLEVEAEPPDFHAPVTVEIDGQLMTID